MEKMSIRNRTILINLALASTLLIESLFYPAWAIATAAAILFPVANGLLLIKAVKKRAQNKHHK